MKTAIIHEWLLSYAGSEKVLKHIVELFPEADLFSIVDFLSDDLRGFILNKKVRTSFIQKLPLARRNYRNYLALMPFAVRNLDLSGYDLIISSAHTAAKGVKKRKGQLHISYCHTPMRYIWDLEHQYLQETGMDKGIKSKLLKFFFNRLRKWDVATAREVDYFIANSTYIKDRIYRAYKRDAIVIYPPVETENFQLKKNSDDFFITVSRMVPYKRIDLIVEAFSRLGLPLIVVGDGPDFIKIKKKASRNVELMGYLRDDVLKIYLRKARAFVFAAEEDFGIAPVEAQACGIPVVAYGRGGIQDTVIPLKQSGGEDQQRDFPPPTGIFFNEQTPASLMRAIERFETVEDIFDPREIRRNAERFNTVRFRNELKGFIDDKVRGFPR